MFQGRPLHRYTYAEYVELERYSPTKHEFLRGEIYAMAGGCEEHSALAAEVVHHRSDDGTWSTRVAISGGRVKVVSAGTDLDVDAIYRKSALSS